MKPDLSYRTKIYNNKNNQISILQLLLSNIVLLKLVSLSVYLLQVIYKLNFTIVKLTLLLSPESMKKHSLLYLKYADCFNRN